MAFTSYTAAFAALTDLNGRILALHANPPRLSAGAEAHEAFAEKRRELNAEAEAAGFVRIFDGTFKLTPAMVALPDQAPAAAAPALPTGAEIIKALREGKARDFTAQDWHAWAGAAEGSVILDCFPGFEIVVGAENIAIDATDAEGNCYMLLREGWLPA